MLLSIRGLASAIVGQHQNNHNKKEKSHFIRYLVDVHS